MTDASNSGKLPNAQARAQVRGIIGKNADLGVSRGSAAYDNFAYEFENQSDIYYAPKNITSAQKMELEDSENSVAFTDTDIPTSSTNYSRPRTVAAGYDASRKTMTVVFRDGTFYNYYEVTQGEWQAFKASVSKGNPWLNRANRYQGSDGLFLSKPRGPADVSNISPEIQELLYKIVRTKQITRGTKLGASRDTRLRSARRSGGLKSAQARRRRKP